MISINQLTKQAVIETQLPTYGKTYTVIPNRDIIETAENSFKINGLKIIDERFRATYMNQVCTGSYFLDYSKDENYNLVFAFTNSYNKQKKFESGVGVSVSIQKKTAEGTEEVKIPIISKVSNWARKHTGTANLEAYKMIDSQILDYTSMYDSVMEDLNMMRNACITKLDFAHMLGEMFVEGVISSTQLNIVYNEFKTPRLFEYVYDKDNDCANLYRVYISICYALMEDHPTTYLRNLSAVHAHVLAYCNKEPELNFDEVVPDNDIDNSIKFPQESIVNTESNNNTQNFNDIVTDEDKADLTEYYDAMVDENKDTEADFPSFDTNIEDVKPFEMPQVEVLPPTIEENDIVVDNEGYEIGQEIEIDGIYYKVKGFAGDLAVCQLL